MQLVEGPTLRPFICIDGSQAGPVVDTLINHPVYGRMYWPKRLVVEAAWLYGMLEEETMQALEDELTTLRATVLDLEGQLAELRPVSDAIARFADRERLEV